MSLVGIVANPASGRDIRRLVAHGSVFDNYEKVNIVRRLLCGMAAAGVRQVWIMPDSFGIGWRACDGLELELEVSVLPMPTRFGPEDSSRAAALMVAGGARCIVTLGGDGTVRAVAKESGDVPLIPISTGTNNVFPAMIEGTVAGLAAGLVACGISAAAVRTAPRLDIVRAGSAADVALVDAALCAEQFVGARAVWEPHRIREVVLTQAEPGSIGLSAIGAHVPGDTLPAGHGLYLRLGPGGRPVLAPIAPGVVCAVSVIERRPLAPGEEIVVHPTEPSVLALDGEREIELRAGSSLVIRLNQAGPRVVDVPRTLALAAAAGYFVNDPGPDRS